MTKKKNENEVTTPRRSRREERFAAQQAAQLRTLRLVGIGLLSLIGLIIIVGLVIELIVVPRQVVAEVQAETIQMGDWQDRVRYERAQLISQLEEQIDLFKDEEAEDQVDAEQNALRTIQQFAGQQIGLLFQGHEQIGDQVLEIMIRESLVRQEAEKRGIAVSQTDIDRAVGERFSYFDGGLPTAVPTATESPEPTPSITPIPTAVPEGVEVVEEEVVDEAEEILPTPEPLPTNTPRPTNTPVSQASFEEQLQEDLDQIDAIGGNPDLYNSSVEAGLYEERLGEALFEDSGEPIVVPHISSYLLVYSTEEEANAALSTIGTLGFLEVWNQARSAPPDPENSSPPQAIERLWLTTEEYEQTYPDELPAILEVLSVGETSSVVQETDVSTSLPIYVIAQVSGREDRELNQFTINRKHQEALQEWLTVQRETDVTVFENWRRRIPRQPGLDAKFVQPVPTPTVPAPEDSLLPTPAG